MNPASVLGFAQAAGKLASGEAACERAVRRGQARLVLVAADAGRTTAKRLARLAGEHGVDWVRWGNKAALGAWIGQRPRAVIAVCDAHFARLLKAAVTNEGSDGFS